MVNQEESEGLREKPHYLHLVASTPLMSEDMKEITGGVTHVGAAQWNAGY